MPWSKPDICHPLSQVYQAHRNTPLPPRPPPWSHFPPEWRSQGLTIDSYWRSCPLDTPFSRNTPLFRSSCPWPRHRCWHCTSRLPPVRQWALRSCTSTDRSVSSPARHPMSGCSRSWWRPGSPSWSHRPVSRRSWDPRCYPRSCRPAYLTWHSSWRTSRFPMPIRSHSCSYCSAVSHCTHPRAGWYSSRTHLKDMPWSSPKTRWSSGYIPQNPYHQSPSVRWTGYFHPSPQAVFLTAAR